MAFQVKIEVQAVCDVCRKSMPSALYREVVFREEIEKRSNQTAESFGWKIQHTKLYCERCQQTVAAPIWGEELRP